MAYAFFPAQMLTVLPLGWVFYLHGTLSVETFITVIILSLGIVFDHVNFSYEDKPILRDISVTLPNQTSTAIVGPSGSGKTTFCNLVARFWDVDSGSVKIGGTDVRDYTLESLMDQISMVFQTVYLFADTIENNIKFGCPNATHEQVVEAAKKACCDDFIEALPDGYNTVIGEGGASLSDGEKQRISIARAMLKDAPIIILDEVTANVAPENEDRLQKAIEALTRNKTILMIAHRLKTVRSADQILVLDGGKIVQQGKHEDLIAQPGIYADFVGGKQESASWKLQFIRKTHLLYFKSAGAFSSLFILFGTLTLYLKCATMHFRRYRTN